MQGFRIEGVSDLIQFNFALPQYPGDRHVTEMGPVGACREQFMECRPVPEIKAGALQPGLVVPGLSGKENIHVLTLQIRQGKETCDTPVVLQEDKMGPIIKVAVEAETKRPQVGYITRDDAVFPQPTTILQIGYDGLLHLCYAVLSPMM